jgi:hypothetical protein
MGKPLMFILSICKVSAMASARFLGTITTPTTPLWHGEARATIDFEL